MLNAQQVEYWLREKVERKFRQNFYWGAGLFIIGATAITQGIIYAYGDNELGKAIIHNIITIPGVILTIVSVPLLIPAYDYYEALEESKDKKLALNSGIVTDPINGQTTPTIGLSYHF